MRKIVPLIINMGNSIPEFPPEKLDGDELMRSVARILRSIGTITRGSFGRTNKIGMFRSVRRNESRDINDTATGAEIGTLLPGIESCQKLKEIAENVGSEYLTISNPSTLSRRKTF